MSYLLPPGVCLVFPAATASTAANIYATTTALTTIGDGPVNLGKTSSATTVDGTMTVAQALTSTGTLNVGAHIVATNTGAAKSVSNTASDLYTFMKNRRKRRDSVGEKRQEKRQRECAVTLTLTHAHKMMNPRLVDSGHDYEHRYDW